MSSLRRSSRIASRQTTKKNEKQLPAETKIPENNNNKSSVKKPRKKELKTKSLEKHQPHLETKGDDEKSKVKIYLLPFSKDVLPFATAESCTQSFQKVLDSSDSKWTKQNTPLGSGIQGTVYSLCRNNDECDKWVLKVSKDDEAKYITKIYREVEIHKALSDNSETRSLVPILKAAWKCQEDESKDEVTVFEVMERLTQTLYNYLNETSNRLTSSEVASLMSIAEKLSNAGVLHGDLNGNNFMRTGEGAWKVIDFGLSNWLVGDTFFPEDFAMFMCGHNRNQSLFLSEVLEKAKSGYFFQISDKEEAMIKAEIKKNRRFLNQYQVYQLLRAIQVEVDGQPVTLSRLQSNIPPKFADLMDALCALNIMGVSSILGNDK